MEILKNVMIVLTTIGAIINCWQFNDSRQPYYGIKMLMWLMITMLWVIL